MKKCSNCKHHKWESWDGYEYCMDYEMGVDATKCEHFEYGDPEDEDEEYRSSSTYGDYSPSHPWDAPGMCVADFIGGVSMY